LQLKVRIFLKGSALIFVDDSNAILPSFCAANFLIRFKEKAAKEKEQAKKSKGQKDHSVTLGEPHPQKNTLEPN
jgi:hypothetical protein